MKPVIKASILGLMFVVAFGGITVGLLVFRSDPPTVTYTIINKHTSGRDHYELAVIGVIRLGEWPRRFSYFDVPKSLYDAAESGSTLEVGINSLAIIKEDNTRVAL